MLSSVVLIGAQKLFNRPIEKIQWAGLIMIIIFGGLTIALRDENFIKLKPTVLYFVLAATLLIPQFFRKYLIKSLLEKQLTLPNDAWKKLNFSWIVFFMFLGFLNLYVAENFSTDFWVEFKLFGMLAITLVFTIIQAIWLARFKNEQ